MQKNTKSFSIYFNTDVTQNQYKNEDAAEATSENYRRSKKLFLFFHIIIFMYETSVSELFKIVIAHIETCFCMFSAYKIPDAIQCIEVYFVQTYSGSDRREELFIWFKRFVEF